MDDFSVNEDWLKFKKDEYPLSKIKGVRVKVNTLKDHLARVVMTGLVVSSIVWMIFPEGFGKFTAPFALLLGAIAALVSVRRYELQIEFQHTDETGLQWVSVAKTNSNNELQRFKMQARDITKKLHTSKASVVDLADSAT
ncbi:DUF6232 family protein [Vibrio sp. Vb339]|uniref:DUF6232 family protein n=1 Tax=Vibrio sp. Vb339 TaxID=1192013 RepID=UPI001C130B47|nr:DUF6232 family protein [Vibrio sp. Vb339]